MLDVYPAFMGDNALPDFDSTRELMRSLGLSEFDARSTTDAFGSWFVIATSKDKLIRVCWDGREGALIIQEPSLSGLPDDWGDRWIAGRTQSKNAGELRQRLVAVLGA